MQVLIKMLQITQLNQKTFPQPIFSLFQINETYQIKLLSLNVCRVISILKTVKLVLTQLLLSQMFWNEYENLKASGNFLD